ncbi:MAG: ferrous iron transport protein B [Gammaproteobacteria bacterium]|nr:ferrous iron transport protein B [Gammaproteobacteria bacterium]
MKATKQIRVALVGNPNTGRTSLFNQLTGAHGPTGNYPRVTVGIESRVVEYHGWEIEFVDLPGIYSLSCRTNEERLSREYLYNNPPDMILNVIDMGHLERNLLLTSQLIEMGLHRLFVLNMADEAEHKGVEVDQETFSKLLGGDVVLTNARSGRGVEQILERIAYCAEHCTVLKPVQIHYDDHLEEAIVRTQYHIVRLHRGEQEMSADHSRWLAIKLLEGDQMVLEQESDHSELMAEVWKESNLLEQQHDESAEMLLNAGRYGFVNGLIRETVELGLGMDRLDMTRLLDNVLLHRVFGLPLFLFFMWVMFESTFTIGQYPMDWIDAGVGHISSFMDGLLPESIFKQLLIDGIIAGVGGTIIFLPNVVILFFFIAFMSESGYLTRSAFLIDRIMHNFGLHGKAFIPMITGFGCNVPAIMATRTIEIARDRLVAMLVIPFMSCSARLPVFILFTGAFFAESSGKVLFAMYMISISVAFVTAVVLSKFIVKGANTSPLLMELPPYRVPTMNSIMHHMGNNAIEFLKKVGGIILVGSMVIWFLETFPQEVELNQDYAAQIEIVAAQPESPTQQQQLTELNQLVRSETQRQRYLGQLGEFVEPVFAPLGFNLESSIAILTGFVAKEVVVATFGVLYARGDDASGEDIGLLESLRSSMTPVSALAFMVFVLFYMPCFATLAMFYKESRSVGWTLFSVVLSLAVAYSLAFGVTVIGGAIT